MRRTVPSAGLQLRNDEVLDIDEDGRTMIGTYSLHYEPRAPSCLEQGTHFSRQRHPDERAHIGIDLEERGKHPMQTLLGNQHVVQDKVVHAGRKKAMYGDR